jgi:hypothetical protein
LVDRGIPIDSGIYSTRETVQRLEESSVDPTHDVSEPTKASLQNPKSACPQQPSSPQKIWAAAHSSLGRISKYGRIPKGLPERFANGCFRCFSLHHWARHCPNPIRCRVCLAYGHVEKRCFRSKAGRKQVWRPKQHQSLDSGQPEVKSTPSTATKSLFSPGAHFLLKRLRLPCPHLLLIPTWCCSNPLHLHFTASSPLSLYGELPGQSCAFHPSCLRSG